MSRYVTAAANLTKDASGGFGKDTGKAYAHLDVVATDRVKTDSGEYVDGPPTYYRVTVFGKTAENAMDSLSKGRRIIFAGPPTVRSYRRNDGQPGVANEVVADHLGADLQFTSVGFPAGQGEDQGANQG